MKSSNFGSALHSCVVQSILRGQLVVTQVALNAVYFSILYVEVADLHPILVRILRRGFVVVQAKSIREILCAGDHSLASTAWCHRYSEVRHSGKDLGKQGQPKYPSYPACHILLFCCKKAKPFFLSERRRLCLWRQSSMGLVAQERGLI